MRSAKRPELRTEKAPSLPFKNSLTIAAPDPVLARHQRKTSSQSKAAARPILSALVFWTLVTGVAAAEQEPPEQSAPSPADAARVHIDDFDGVVPTWRIEESSSLGGIRSHKRTDNAPFRGRRCEQVSVIGLRGGETILATHEVPASAVIEELRIRVALRSIRTGFQVMARVRLPRTLDEDGEAVSFYVRGDTYGASRIWQELVLERIEEKVADAVRAKRIQLGKHVDPSGAFVDQVAINLFGGAGLNTVWIDDLSLEGMVPLSESQWAERRQPIQLVNHGSSPAIGARLHTDKVTWIPRGVTYHGESVELLKQLGFNTLWLQQLPTPQFQQQARERGIWLISPPPGSSDAAESYDRVIAWQIDPNRCSPEAARRTVRSLRADDPLHRPIVGVTPSDHLTADDWLSGVLDIAIERKLRHGSYPAATSAGSKWLLVESPLVATSRWLPLREKLWQGIDAGYAGFFLRTSESLELPSARNTRNLIELFNIELRTFQPWIARPQLDRYSNQGEASPFDVRVLLHHHSSLAFVKKRPDAAPFHGQHEIVVPTPKHPKVFRLEPGGLSPLADRRVAGGIRISLDRAKPDGVLLLTDQPNIVEATNKHLREIRVRTSQLMIEILRAELIGLDNRLQHTVADRRLRSHLRREVHALHGRIAPLLESDDVDAVNFRELDHVLGQLERVHQSISP